MKRVTVSQNRTDDPQIERRKRRRFRMMRRALTTSSHGESLLRYNLGSAGYVLSLFGGTVAGLLVAFSGIVLLPRIVNEGGVVAFVVTGALILVLLVLHWKHPAMDLAVLTLWRGYVILGVIFAWACWRQYYPYSVSLPAIRTEAWMLAAALTLALLFLLLPAPFHLGSWVLVQGIVAFFTLAALATTYFVQVEGCWPAIAHAGAIALNATYITAHVTWAGRKLRDLHCVLDFSMVIPLALLVLYMLSLPGWPTFS